MKINKPDWRDKVINFVCWLFAIRWRIPDPDQEFLLRKRDLWRQIMKIKDQDDIEFVYECLYEFSFHYKYRSDITRVVYEMEKAMQRKEFIVVNMSKVQ